MKKEERLCLLSGETPQSVGLLASEAKAGVTKHTTRKSCWIPENPGSQICFLQAAGTRRKQRATPAFDCWARQAADERSCHWLRLNYCGCEGWWRLCLWRAGIGGRQAGIRRLTGETFHWHWHSKYQAWLGQKNRNHGLFCDGFSLVAR